jgi:hypothetical protein
VTKAFDTVWVDGLVYIALNFPSYLVKPFHPICEVKMFEISFKAATLSRRGMRAGVTQGELISRVLFSLFVYDMPVTFHHVELALYADETAIVATSCKQLCLSATWNNISPTQCFV